MSVSHKEWDIDSIPMPSVTVLQMTMQSVILARKNRFHFMVQRVDRIDDTTALETKSTSAFSAGAGTQTLFICAERKMGLAMFYLERSYRSLAVQNVMRIWLRHSLPSSPTKVKPEREWRYSFDPSPY